MTVDITKLTGPELAAQIRAAWVVNDGTPPLTEALRRIEEDERVWQRNLERERDAWRALAESRERELTGRIKSSVGGRVSELERDEIVSAWREWANELCQVAHTVVSDDALRAMIADGERMPKGKV